MKERQKPSLMGRQLATFAILGLLIFPSVKVSADPAQAEICSERVRKFVEEIDHLLASTLNDVLAFKYPIKKYLPIGHCNIADVISISKESKFFSKAYDWGPAYTIIFRNYGFEITFALRKDSGNIEYPAAKVRLPKRIDQKI